MVVYHVHAVYILHQVGDTVTFDKLPSEAQLSQSGHHSNQHHQHQSGIFRAAHVQLADKAKRGRYVKHCVTS
jgi:hypothetical protein